MAPAPTWTPRESDTANVAFNATVQIGPATGVGATYGYYYATSMAFYMDASSDATDQPSAYYFTPNGWIALPYNKTVNVSGTSPICWAFEVPAGAQIVFYMGPPQ